MSLLKQQVKDRMLHAIANHRTTMNPRDRHAIRRIIDDTSLYTNSLNIVMGRQGCGKTFLMFSRAIAISHVLPETHLIICATKKSFDESLEATKSEANVPVLMVPYEELVDTLQVLIEAKKKYNELIRLAVEYNVSQEELIDQVDDVETLFTALHINDFSRCFLQTIVILDDVGSSHLLRNLDSFVNNRLKLTRDDGIIWFLGCHSLNDLSPTVKSNADTVSIAKGLPINRVEIIYRQVNSGVEWEEFMDIYYGIERVGSRFLTVDNRDQTLEYD